MDEEFLAPIRGERGGGVNHGVSLAVLWGLG